MSLLLTEFLAARVAILKALWVRRLGLLAVLLVWLAGCAGPNTNSGSVFSRDDGPSELHLLVMPGSVRFPAPNPQPGFAVRVFACTGTSARGVPIRGGTLEILGFEGSPADAAMRTSAPAQLWSYSAADLAPLQISSSLGTGYELALPWRGQLPTTNRLTLVVRHRAASGPLRWSAPSVVPNPLSAVP